MEAIFLQLQSPYSNTINYLPIVLQAIFALVLVGGLIFATSMLGPKRKTADKLINFESGIEAQGNARQPMAVK